MSDIRDKQDAFDATMRDSYRLATQQVSAATRARLRQARHAATSGEARKRSYSWPLLFGGAAAAVFAVAFGLGLREQALPPGSAPPATVASTAGYDDTASALDQDPDFYAWLGSSDAELVAVE